MTIIELFRMRNYLITIAVLLLVAFGFLASAVQEVVFRRPGTEVRWDSFLVGSVGVILLAWAFASLRNVYGGRLVCRVTRCMRLTDETTIAIPITGKLFGGRILVMLSETTDRFSGTISAYTGEGLTAIVVGTAELRPRRPTVRMRVPRWLPVSERGGVLELWPKGTGRGDNLVVIPLDAMLWPGSVLTLRFNLASNFVGTEMEHRYAVSSPEVVTIVVRASKTGKRGKRVGNRNCG